MLDLARVRRNCSIDEQFDVKSRLRAFVGGGDHREEIADGVGSLLDFWSNNSFELNFGDWSGEPVKPPRVSADSLGWDLYRLLGPELGFADFDRLLFEDGENVPIPEVEKRFASFDRERRPDDLLLIDEFDEADFSGWMPPNEFLRQVIDGCRGRVDLYRKLFRVGVQHASF